MGYVQETQLRAFPKEFIHPTQWQSDQLPECSDGASSLTSASLSVSEHHLDTPSARIPRPSRCQARRILLEVGGPESSQCRGIDVLKKWMGRRSIFEGNEGCLESWMFGEP